MLLPWALLSSLFVVGIAEPVRRTYDTHDYYVLRHDPLSITGAPLVEVLQTLGVELVEQAGELKNHWLVRRRKPPGLVTRDYSDPVLSTFKMFQAQANAPLAVRSPQNQLARRITASVDYLSLQTLRTRTKRAPPPISPPPRPFSQDVAARFGIHDPLFPKQWHLVNDDFPEHMMNVTGVWDMGFKGKGVISSLVDDGLEYESEDLSQNFDAENSFDFNDHQKLPTPKNYDDHHGTRCAGQVAAQKNNVCGVGIAYESKVAGVRILSGPISDVDEAAALNYGFQNVSIYSCSWGPPDNGQSMEGPNYLIKKAVVNGINNGRGGKGSIFVFASGNGAGHGDQCNFDGYTNSIYSITVSAVDYKGLHPYYSETCAANMIVAYSSGSGRHIVTTDKGKNACATTHGGTSAAAPNAVGVFALALQVRPDLTWRDVQHLCIETARMINAEDPDWEDAPNGKRYSYKYGFGVLDAYHYVKAAQTWKLVKPQAWYQTKAIQLNNGTYHGNTYERGEFIAPGGIESKTSITKEMLEENNLETLEHINVKVWIGHTTRGEVEVELVSPNGIRSILGGARAGDRDSTGYPGWTFMTVKHWGENPIGDWTLKVKDQNKPNSNGTFIGWNMIFWGSSNDPSRAHKFEVPLGNDDFPPAEIPARPVIVEPTSTTSKQHAKPTNHLPGDHGVAAGEKTKPAFPSSTVGSTATTTTAAENSSPATISGTPDIGWFSDMSKLVTSQKWFFIALGAVSSFGIGVGIFFLWRRRMARTRAADYAPLDDENGHSMTALGTSVSGPRTTRELYDAFGEVSDDDDDETTALRQPLARSGGLGFHSGFLDDDDPSTTTAGIPSTYRDEPGHQEEPSHSRLRETPHDGESSSSPTGSADGSWEHA
ncbi:hypothetical protein NLJ89_g1980 [Agrocybe chaxingu]|uniref:P/Homo B domain-containing protein n=1 Tax=Agrocybe chaxingu TaxID=84603 RepID=A0A9W8MZ08_9AGAR|nr:hypothetical protein NLJ89_g1980 [Agrocybe chaxingu]